jgi:hypothetical protein
MILLDTIKLSHLLVEITKSREGFGLYRVAIIGFGSAAVCNLSSSSACHWMQIGWSRLHAVLHTENTVAKII